MPVPATSLDAVLSQFPSQLGHTLAELSAARDVLVVFLRHSGCTFCREALADLHAQRERIEAAGIRLALVHMGREDQHTARFFAAYQLDDVDRYSDPERQLYRAFELSRGNFWQLLGPAVWWRGAQAFFRGHGIGWLNGDGMQLPGVFLLRAGRVIREFRHRTAADRPEYATLACPR
ncbi:MAG: peroxiredoxin-like family protein [Pirellulales bacterium]|nr:peroxiredoxin-like family protein [Pirellulales bacterium]